MTRGPSGEAEVFDRQVFYDQLTARFAELRSDPVAWAEIEQDRALESHTLTDQSR